MPSKNGIRYGTSTPPPILEQSNDTVPFIRATDIKNGEILTDNLLHIEKNQLKKMQKCLLKEGEMIVVRSGVNTGDCATVPESLAGSYGAYDLIVRFSNDIIPSFISTFLDTNIGRLQLNLLKGRSAQSHLNAEEISSIVIPKPSIEIQKSLVAEIEAARQNRKQKLAQAEDLLSSIDNFILTKLSLKVPSKNNNNSFSIKLKDCISNRFDAIYHQPFYKQAIKLLKSCPYQKKLLSDIVFPPIGGATPRRSATDLYTDDITQGIKFLRIQNIKPFEIDLTDVKLITNKVHAEQLNRSQLKANDILMTITGRVGTTAIVDNSILPANINQHIVILRLKILECLPEYLVAYLNSSFGLELSNHNVTGGTRIALDYDAIMNIVIPVPSLDIQKEIISEINIKRNEFDLIKQEAELEWETAKTRFEQKLLGEET